MSITRLDTCYRFVENRGQAIPFSKWLGLDEVLERELDLCFPMMLQLLLILGVSSVPCSVKELLMCDVVWRVMGQGGTCSWRACLLPVGGAN